MSRRGFGWLIAGLLLLAGARAQTPAAFEVASIRRNNSGGVNTRISVAGDRFTATNASVKTLIRNAYEILSFQLANEPGWLDSEMFDLTATTGSGKKISPDQLKLLLRGLLADRFGLKVHWETRQTAVYALVADKGGSKLRVNSGMEEPGINTQRGQGGRG